MVMPLWCFLPMAIIAIVGLVWLSVRDAQRHFERLGKIARGEE